MTLAEYIQQLRGDESYERLGEAIGISSATVFRIGNGKTTQPTPDVLEKLARYFGKTESERQEIYAAMMWLAGYLDLMPPHLRPAQQEAKRSLSQQREDAMRESDDVARDYGLDERARDRNQSKEQNGTR